MPTSFKNFRISKVRASSSLKVVDTGSVESLFDLSAASELSTSKERAEEGAARVRVDLDQLGAIVIQVEIIAHEGATRPMIVLRDSGTQA